MSQNKKPNAAIVLTLIAVVAALVLALTNAVTSGPIAEHERAALAEALGKVMPLEEGGKYNEVKDGLTAYSVTSLYDVLDANGEVIGYCVSASQKGYGGLVGVTMGLDKDGVVTGVVITTPSETAGIGSRASEDSFAEEFPGLSAVDGGSFLPLSGATVTSKAVLGAVNEALRCVAEVKLGHAVDTGDLISFGQKEAPAQVDVSGLKPGATMRGAAEGYAGAEVIVTFKLGDDLTITDVTVDASSQTPGFGQRCADDQGFLGAIVGKTLPVTVDVLSGATITSGAVEMAINSASEVEAAAVDFSAAKPVADDKGVKVGELDGHLIVSAEENVTGDVTVTYQDGKVVSVTIVDANDPYAGQEAGAPEKTSAAGFGGEPVFVTVTRYADGAIASVKVDASLQMGGVGAVCEKDAFTKQFIGKKGPFVLGENIDGCSGATFTSQGVVDAINALPAAAPAPVEAPAPVAVEEKKVQAPGFGGEPVFVTVGLDAEGNVASVKVDASLQMAGIGLVCEKDAFTKQFIGKKGPFTLGDGIDGCSGATFTSQGVVDAVNQVFAAAAPAEEAVPAPVMAEEKKVQAPGFGGEPVFVTVGLDAEGNVASVKVDASLQMGGVGAVCEKDAFTKQFIGKKGPFTLGDGIDGCSGATFTSQGVVDALNQLFAAPAVETAEVATPADVAAPVVAEEKKVQAPGFGGEPVFVTVGLDAEGNVASVKVDASLQMGGVGAVCEKDAFTKQFIGKKGPFTLGDGIDGCSGATFTSQGVVDAINQLFQ